MHINIKICKARMKKRKVNNILGKKLCFDHLNIRTLPFHIFHFDNFLKVGL
jgi:hypothetical protein